jgi:hypothetical protein
MSTMMIQTILWVAAGAALVLFLMRRKNRKAVR